VEKALPRDSIYITGNSITLPAFDKPGKQRTYASLETENRYAVLTIKDFHNDVLRKEYKQKFDKEISLFEQIKYKTD
jgi:hypothetical protein